MDEAKAKLDEVRKQQKAEMPTAESQEVRIARRVMLAAQAKALQAALDSRETEMTTFDSRKALYHAQRDLAVRAMKDLEKQVGLWEELVNSRRQAEAVAAAQEAKRQLASAMPAVRKLAEVNAHVALERSGPEGPAAKIKPLSGDTGNIKKAQKLLEAIKTRADQVKQKIGAAGLTSSISMLLRKERINLPDARLYNQKIKIRQREISDVLARLVQLEEDLAWYSEIDGRVTETLSELGKTVRPDQRPEIEEEIREILKNLVSNHEALIKDYDNYFTDLVTLDTVERDILRQTTEYAKSIDENVFWFPSTRPLMFSSIIDAGKALGRVFDLSSWRQVFRTLGQDLRTNWNINGLAILLIGGILYIKHSRWLPRLQARAQENSFANTLRMLVETLLIAAIWPGILLYLVWRLMNWPEATDFVKEVAAGLYATAFLFLTMEILLKMCLPNGIAEQHFKWSSENSKIIRDNLYWLMAVGLPMVFMMTALEWEQDEPGKVSLGRLAFIVLLIGFSVFMQRVLGPIRHALQRSWASRWEGWGTWTHYVWFPLAMGIPVLLAVLAGIGYYYTAMELSWRLLATLWLLMGMMIVREMLLRWLVIARHQLAAKRGTITPSPALSGSTREEPGVNVLVIGDQARKLLDSFVILILGLGLWAIWEQVIPAMGKLKQVDIITFKLWDLFMAIVVFFMTYIAGKNIPGLLEMTILPQLPLDSGLRFAITRVTRYMIIVVGSSISLWFVGVEWKDLQWLIAAMTVGLSFGLQEIFANFVSGLIILFERPMRVGDIVTVGSVTGTVSKIQIRATTITDSDRKELIVPNKEFITSQVVNWTLSDRVLRLTIPIGIGYGSDTDLAQKLLLRVAEANPKVLKNPVPQAIFTGFGDSAINFELGVFTTVENFGILRHELNTAINHAFREAQIQIPFPQQEIHVRSFSDILTTVGQKIKPAPVTLEADKNWPKIP